MRSWRLPYIRFEYLKIKFVVIARTYGPNNQCPPKPLAFDLLMTHTKAQHLTLWNHRVTISQSCSCLECILPVRTEAFLPEGRTLALAKLKYAYKAGCKHRRLPGGRVRKSSFVTRYESHKIGLYFFLSMDILSILRIENIKLRTFSVIAISFSVRAAGVLLRPCYLVLGGVGI
jgi:hypothetical protein